MRIEGEVHIADVPGGAAAATAHVRLQDVSRADAVATTVAEVTLDDVRFPGDSPLRLPFVFEVDDARLDPRASYAVAVHVDLTGSGEVTAGDYVTVQTVPVSVHGSREPLHVPVQAVR
ncbi:YbaY family lipoprotein [Pseudonocardia nigra]|uniref:YbaY family lipoprotein n=1 Tax=Pseudonocardia nigra TaxID=1921578 RepID=UPI001C5EE003|nr:YbaY family lipoprotein [Pseudonocardia nigra]